MALNACGSSEWSELGYESTNAEKPFPPTSLELISKMCGSIKIRWMASDARGEPIVNYNVELLDETLFLSCNYFIYFKFYAI